MSDFVTDTHALLWHLSEDPALSTTAKGTFRLADTGQAGTMRRIPRETVPDMPDRIIAATALF